MDLAELTTLRLGGSAKRLVEAATENELIDAVNAADRLGQTLIVGGGSNLVVADAGFDGTVVLVRSSGVDVSVDTCSGASVTVQAGQSWDDFVAEAVGRGWVGIEALAGIPGRVGAVPIQNVGAYGQEVCQTIASVRTYDRHAGEICTFAASDCDFGYRTSRFKALGHRYLVLSVTFQFRLGDLSPPIEYAELARVLGVETGQRALASDVRDAVLELRRSKGMVLDEADHDTWSAGSFFTNPILDPQRAALLPEGAPRYRQSDGRMKTSAAWLIDHAGFGKGYGTGAVGLSSKHVLALTNRGGASTAELLMLARKIRSGVHEQYGIELDNEPVLVNCAL